MSDDIQIVTDQKAQDIMAAAAPDNPAEVVITETFITDEGDVVSNGEFMANFSKMAQKKARGDDDVSASSLKVGIQKYIEAPANPHSEQRRRDPIRRARRRAPVRPLHSGHLPRP